MPGKKPEPWYREGRGWYVCLDGKQHALGKDKAEAFRRFHLLMAGAVPEPETEKPKPEPSGPEPALTVQAWADAYLADCRRRLQANTYRVADAFVRSFAGAYGTLRADTVRKHHVEAWIAQHPRWGQSTEGMAKTRVIALFRWAVEQELLTATALKGLRKPPTRSRGAETLITPEQHALLMAKAEPCFGNVLFALHQSGARPGEVTTVTAADFHPEQAVWILPKHKTAHKGQSRIVHLTPALTALCRELAAKHPEGPLFRTQKGTPYGWCGLSKRMGWIRQRLGLPATVTVYGYRHTYATDGLAKGIPDTQVAALLGHSGTAQLHKHYSHLTAQAQALREALGKVR